MRIVIYDREDMEPITVIALPEWAREFLGEIEKGERGPEITFPVQRPMSYAEFNALPTFQKMTLDDYCCRLRFEPIWKGPKRLMWLCTTMDGESALLLKSTFLPGQQGAVNEACKNAFLDGLMAAMGAH